MAPMLDPKAPLQHVKPEQCLKVLILRLSLLLTTYRGPPTALHISGAPPALRGVQAGEAADTREREAGAAHGVLEAGAERVAADRVLVGAGGGVDARHRGVRRVQHQRIVLEGAGVGERAGASRVVHCHHVARAPERAEWKTPAYVLAQRRQRRPDRRPRGVASARGVRERRLQPPRREPGRHDLVKDEDRAGLFPDASETRQSGISQLCPAFRTV